MKLDISKAYDRVHRERLLDLLRRKNLPDYILQTLINGFLAPHHLRDGEALTDAFTTACGIKQGCPASPTVFNLLLADLLPYVRAAHHLCHSHTNHTTFPVQFYADDGLLASHDLPSLHSLLDATATYLEYYGLELSIPKCELLVVPPSPPPTMPPPRQFLWFRSHLLISR